MIVEAVGCSMSFFVLYAMHVYLTYNYLLFMFRSMAST